ncbi:MAG: NUDIX domain-containing protein [Defluviitaleaceae bacterium]|nr:NUDIX domain-containing protein [Defluviitaleaceae bacterium]
MITTRITAGAFLICGDKVLLMKRGLHKEIGAGMWAGVGGHLDMSDITNPRAIDTLETCYREVHEETGILRTDIHDLKLRYIAVRKVDGEVHLVYHYFGRLEQEILPPECSEGEFFWIDKIDLTNLPMSRLVGEAVHHWVRNPDCDKINLIVVDNTGTSAVISGI